MKSTTRKLTLCALLGVSMSAQAAPVLIYNGDFSIPGGAGYGYFESAPGVVSFPATGGSGDNGGYGLINNTVGTWGGGLVSPPDNFYAANQGIPLATLGLVAGNTYTFSMDMKNFAGSGKGGLKLESWNGGGGAFNFTPDMPASASSNQWATYTWNYAIPAGATSLKLVPLLTPPTGGTNADSIGFDNIKVNNTPVPPPPFIPDVILNGDFEIPGGSGWGTAQGTPSYPTTGGNPSGHTILDGTAGFAVLYAFNNTEKTFASLGLSPGDTYTFQMDMKLISGSNIGGLRLEGPAGYVIESYPTIIGDGTSWATYSIQLTVPSSPAQAKFGLRPGLDSVVAFDNVKIVLPGPPAPLQAEITLGNSVSWTAASAVNQYQPQESATAGGPWTNAGPAYVGNSVTSIFDETKSPFYRVMQSAPVIQQTVYNGGFEEDDGFDGAEGWEELGFTGPDQDIDQAPLRILTGAHTGTANMRVKVQNAAVAAQSGKSLLMMNTFNADPVNGKIIPGNTYTFSFWAKQISAGVSYVQQYKVAFLNGASAVVGTTGDVNFSAGAAWTQITVNGLVAPAGAETALIEIVGLTGAVDNGSGEVHIDDVSLLSTGFGPASVLVPSPVVSPAVEVSWMSKTGQNYQVQSSPNLSTWTNFGPVISGNGSIKAVYDTMIDKEFFRVGELP